MNSQTRNNLITAMHGEAFAYLKYMLFARHARENGRYDLANLFEKTANVERLEHFAEEAALLGLIGSDTENLRAAITGESYEVNSMYRRFAEEAAAAGDKEAEALFNEVRHDEAGHLAGFEAALDEHLVVARR